MDMISAANMAHRYQRNVIIIPQISMEMGNESLSWLFALIFPSLHNNMAIWMVYQRYIKAASPSHPILELGLI